jgi:hypothetical protein
MKKRRVLSVAETTLRVGAVASGREGRWGGQSCSSCMRLGYGCRMRLCVRVLWGDNGEKKQENSYAHWAEIKSGRWVIYMLRIGCANDGPLLRCGN